MKRLFLALAFVASVALPATAAAQTAPGGCQFVLGFQTLQAMDSNDIGTCTDNQIYAPNGDAVQHTSKGLMAWRKADNWTAFTNGYMTWINGPDGLVSRLNTDRFPWEGADAAAPAPAPAASAAPAASPAPSSASLALGPGEVPNVGGAWKLMNNQALFNLHQDFDAITISSQAVRQCTANGVVNVPTDQLANAPGNKSMQSTIMTGILSGFTISGSWYSCQANIQSWVAYPIQLTVSGDLLHMSGQLQEPLTFDRVG